MTTWNYSRLKPLPQSSLLLVGAALAAILLFPFASLADTMDEEIDYLLNAVEKSDCTFVRNGKRHSGEDARAHLQSKRRHNAHLFDSADEFIERIASKSSMSGKSYLISCKGQNQQTAAEWFTALLMQRRKDNM
jgi:hypothetical protein